KKIVVSRPQFRRVSNAKPTKPVPPVRNALLFRIIVSTSMATRSFWMLAVPFVAEDLALRAVCFGNMKILIIRLSRVGQRDEYIIAVN
ncbi:hypothetical protein ERO13_D06G075900v2, partial [Gossypium hirsutum]